MDKEFNTPTVGLTIMGADGLIVINRYLDEATIN